MIVEDPFFLQVKKLKAALIVREFGYHVERGSVENFGYDESEDGEGGSETYDESEDGEGGSENYDESEDGEGESETLPGPDEHPASLTDDDSDVDGPDSENSGWASAPEEGADEESGRIASGRFEGGKKKKIVCFSIGLVPY